MRSDEQAIREIHSMWIDAVNAGDLAPLLTMTTDDVALIIPGEVVIGRDEYAAKFSGAQEQFRIHCVSELEEVVVVGEVAYTRARDSLTVSPRAGGEESRLAGDRLTIYRKQPDGRWLLARDANALSPVGG
ncbi:YybH family protein [Tundrisphaera sp. TA3]|uniref:YybH family protein n=1 Tax=Tundrisphaera sp. TA3 TaxID=3435775 RepID=UPI003EBE67DF